MALQNSQRNMQFGRSIKHENIGSENENVLPGKQMVTNVSKIPTRSVLGIVNQNCMPERRDTNNILKPSGGILKSISSTALQKNVQINKTSQNRSSSIKRSNSVTSFDKITFLKPVVPRATTTTLKTDNTAKFVKTTKPEFTKNDSTLTNESKVNSKAPSKPSKLRPRLTRTDSTASIINSQSSKNKIEVYSDIEKCEAELNNVSLEDVDLGEENDPFLLGSYIKDIYKYLFELENQYTIQEDYLNSTMGDGVKRSIVPKYRSILVDYLIDMQQQYTFFSETLFLAVFILDKFLELEPSISKTNLQCVGVTALFIASKFEEIQLQPLDEFSVMTDKYVTSEQILAMEVVIMNKLNFSFNRPYPITFLRRFSKVAKADKIPHTMAKYFLEMALNDYSLVHEKPSKVAAAAIYLAHFVLEGNGGNLWSKKMIHYTTYTLEDIMPVVEKLARAVVDNSSEKSPKYKSAKEKYNKSSNFHVARHTALLKPLPEVITLARKAQVSS